MLHKFEDELMPLRKTGRHMILSIISFHYFWYSNLFYANLISASEPNLKVRSALKQKVMDRRCSPLLKRKNKRLNKGPLQLIQQDVHSAPVSASSSSKQLLCLFVGLVETNFMIFSNQQWKVQHRLTVNQTLFPDLHRHRLVVR